MSEVIVETTYGKIRGKLLTDIKGNTFYGFQGIPYAKPPLGNLRFKAPQPPEKWTDIRDATSESDECYQRHMIFQTIIGSEDCLYLNVYTPDLPDKTTSLKPVMVWIHGGAFTGGSGKSDPYGPELLITEDVLIVTINYRLGVLGFLSLEDLSLDVPGNAALKDMVLALKWIQQNIQYFNGDPNNVTVFGESAGAVAVHFLMMSPLSKGLFHKAIAQSGCALAHWAITSSCTNKLSQLLGFTSDDPRETLDFLQNLSVAELHRGQEMLQESFGISRNRPIGPVIEKECAEAFVTQDPFEIIRSGQYHKVPLLIGYNNREGLFFDIVQNRMKTNTMVTDFETVVPTSFKLERGSEKSMEIARKIKEFYYGDEEITEKNKDKYYQLETDVVFLKDIYKTVRLHTKTSRTPVYMYRFSVDAKMNMFKALGKLTAPGAAHGDELGYLFKMFLTPKEISTDTVEGKTVCRLLKMWTNFARTGDPNSLSEDHLINIKWEPATTNKINFLNIGEELLPGVNPDFERIAFWDEIYSQYSEI